MDTTSPSAIGRTTTSNNQARGTEKVESGLELFVARDVFPFFHEMLVNRSAGGVFGIIVSIVKIIQFVSASLSTTSMKIWGENPSISIVILRCFLDLGVYQGTVGVLVYSIVLGFQLVIVGAMFYVFFQFKKFHRYTDSQMFIATLIYLFLNIVFAPISASIVFVSFSQAVQVASAANIAWFVAFFIVFVIIYFFAWIVECFSGCSTVIRSGYGSHWSPEPVVWTFNFVILSAASPFLDLLPGWGLGIASALTIAMLCYILYLRSFFVAISFDSNVAWMALCCYAIVNKMMVMCVAAMGESDKSEDAMGIVGFVIFLVCIPIVSFWMVKRRNGIIAMLNPIGDEQLQEDEKFMNFDELELSSEWQISMYLYVGISYSCCYILDRSFLKYATNRFGNDHVLFAVLRIMCVFPGEQHFYGYIMELLSQREDYEYTWGQQYFLYQMRKLDIMRRNICDASVWNEIEELRKISREGIDAIRSLWPDIVDARTVITIAVFKRVMDMTESICVQFSDLAKKYPRNPDICGEYARFLIEGVGDFEKGIEWQNREALLREGVVIDVDYSFKSFVNMFPQYLIAEIATQDGTLYSDNDIEVTPLNGISGDTGYVGVKHNGYTTVIPEARLRVATQKALGNTYFVGQRNFTMILWFQMVLLTVVFALWIIFVPMIATKTPKITQVTEYMTQTSAHLHYLIYVLALDSAVHNSKFGGIDTVIGATSMPRSEVEADIVALSDPLETCTKGLKLLADSFLDLVINLNEILASIPDISKMLFDPSFVFNMYDGEIEQYEITDVTMKQVYLKYVNLVMEAIVMGEDGDSGYTDRAKSLVIMGQQIASVYESMRVTTLFSWEDVGDAEMETSLLMGCAGLIGVLIFFLPFNLIWLVRLNVETRDIISMLERTHKSIVSKSLVLICSKADDLTLSDNSVLITRRGNLIFPFLFTITIMSVVCPSLLLFFATYEVHELVGDSQNYMTWHYLSGLRLMSVLRAMTCAISMHTFTESDLVSAFNDSFIDAKMNVLVGQEGLLAGTDISRSVVGADSTLDEDHFMGDCSYTEGTSNLANFLKCNAIDRSISYAHSMLTRITYRLWDGSIGDMDLEDEYARLIALVDLRLFPGFMELQGLYTDFVINTFSSLDSRVMIVCVVGIVSSIAMILIILITLRYMTKAHDGIKQMVRFLPPDEIMNSMSLLSLVLDSSDQDPGRTMSPSQSVIAMSEQAAVSVDANGAIETVNNAFMKLTGFTREQILGQTLLAVLSRSQDDFCSTMTTTITLTTMTLNTVTLPCGPTNEADGIQQIVSVMQMMATGRKDLVDSIDIHMMLGSGKPLDARVVIIGVGEANTNGIGCQSFVLFMKDLTQEMEHKERARDAKLKVEELMRHMIPPDVRRVMSIDKGNACFHVDHATVITIRLEGAVDAVHVSTSTNMLVRLNSFIGVCDTATDQYPAVHGIETTGDSYVAVCGLFDFIDKPVDQMLQAMSFCADIASMRGESRGMLHDDLQIMCGIAYGGPVGGGIIDPDRLVFELFGDIVRTSERLARLGTPGFVHVNEGAKSLIDDLEGYVFEPSNKMEGGDGFNVKPLKTERKCMVTGL